MKCKIGIRVIPIDKTLSSPGPKPRFYTSDRNMFLIDGDFLSVDREHKNVFAASETG